jgi:TPR repeat protein
MSNLAVLLAKRSEQADLVEAEQWLRRAATDHHDPGAMYNLAVLLAQRGEQADLAEAEQRFERARQRGVDDPQ